MTYINRFERIKEISEDASKPIDWLYARGLRGESEYLWNYFKDKVKLRLSLDGKPDLTEWCQKIYDDHVPDEYKHRSQKPHIKFLTCQSAAREGEPFAVMISSLQRWLMRHYSLVQQKAEDDTAKSKATTVDAARFKQALLARKS